MKQLGNNLFFCVCLFFVLHLIWANPIFIHYFSELKFDSTGWILEMLNNGIDHGFVETVSLDSCYLASRTDTAYFKPGILLDENYLLITQDSLQAPLYINPLGDEIILFLPNGFRLDYFCFGTNCTYSSSITTPAPNQSVSIIDDCFYLDNTPTLGQPNDTLNAMGLVDGFITDTSGEPLSDVKASPELLYVYGNKYLPSLAVTDSNGHFLIRALASRVAFWLSKDNYQSKYMYVRIFPETTVTATCSLQLKQSVANQQSPSILSNYELLQNYPNPFNNLTTLSYNIPIDDYIEINVYDINSRLITNLYAGFQKAGQHRLNWDALLISSGVYFYRLQSANITISQKCLLLT